MRVSTRLAISYPSAARTDRPDIPQHFDNVVSVVDPIVMLFKQGTNAARLAAVHQANGGLIWYATDTGGYWYDDGATWTQINPPVISGATIATTVAGLGTAVNGKIGRIRAGSSPYQFKDLVYDSTYGKWVSPVEIWADNKATIQGSLPTFQDLAYSEGNFPYWGSFDTAGLTWEVNFMLRTAGYIYSGGTTTFQVGYSGVDDNDLVDTGLSLTGIPSTAIAWASTSSATSGKIRKSGWVAKAGTPTVKAYIALGVQCKNTVAAGDGSGERPTAGGPKILGRWVA